MLPKINRLTKQRDLGRVKKVGRLAFFNPYRVRFLANRQSASRFTVVASTKVSKKASQRNRLKRQVREILRLNLPKIKGGYDLIIFLTPMALNFTYQRLECQLLELLVQLQLLKND
ncbi:MAG: ribonuclease P protein component [Candidatus Buchananbacteria bacterium RIFCSPHIGHO2_01_FULL_39_14]|uniref:Ribonuclease P protein component n=1 Tax=Candidatus Buchananbacteria bacterium RIFCSPHIGHO2_01_FULL_39_14 TaxID=1797532 RepID=A0A1G1XX31_9BACT|nr:MAG: ribonuclease P protein component [Candidatus Buchananbacteria bacterium RIFCSPHIGHO2_01_FULL_39_14]